MAATRAASADDGTDPWRRYVELRRRALRELSRTRDLSYFTAAGIFGAVSSEGRDGGGVWVLRPEAAGRLERILEQSSPEWVAITEAATAVVSAVTRSGCVVLNHVRAMELLTLAEVPTLPLPPEVTLHHVDETTGDNGISLEEALLVDMMYGGSNAASARRDLPREADVLRSLRGVTLLAGVDAGGNCVGTAGTRVVGRSALVSAVVTIPAYRGRGIAAALTSAALHAARRAGATRAFLDASQGESVYVRLGFRTIGTVTRCERPPSAG